MNVDEGWAWKAIEREADRRAAQRQDALPKVHTIMGVPITDAQMAWLAVQYAREHGPEAIASIPEVPLWRAGS